MNRQHWTTPTDDKAASRRAGGRRRFNAQRQRRMWERRFNILKALALSGDLRRGGQQRLAERFGVDKSVICRDLVWVRSTGFVGCGLPVRCSYRRRAVTVEIEFSSAR